MRRTLAVFVVLLLAGCAAAPERPPAADPHAAWEQRRAALAEIDAWSLRGRIAVRTGDDAWNADIAWTQRGAAWDIRLDGPLGSGTVLLDGDRDGVTLRTSEEERVYSDRDAERLLYRRTGLRVPVSALAWWVRGLPRPGMDTEQGLDPFGRLDWLRQGGWRIDFRDYVRVAGRDMPRRVFVDNHRLSVRLVIDDWTLTAEPAAPSLSRR